MKNIKKEILILFLSFVAGLFVMFIAIKINGNPLYKEGNPLIKAINKVKDSAFLIETYNMSNKDSTGSCFIYKVDNKYAYLLTNEHVVSGNIIKIKNESFEEEGTLLGKDAYLDLAVVRVPKKHFKKAIEMGSSEKMQVGETIFTVGSPLGEKYIGSVTSGILSGKNRLVQTELEDKTTILMGVLQVDAPINHGNSGGPLLNLNGEVIGIISMKLVDEEIEGMGFAIPIEYVKEYLSDLEKGKRIEWPELGAKITDVINSGTLNSNGIKISSKITSGVVILNVNEDSNASRAKLKKGDVIIGIDDNPITDTASFKYALLKHRIGDTITIKYIRDDKEKTKSIKIK